MSPFFIFLPLLLITTLIVNFILKRMGKISLNTYKKIGLLSFCLTLLSLIGWLSFDAVPTFITFYETRVDGLHTFILVLSIMFTAFALWIILIYIIMIIVATIQWKAKENPELHS